MQSHLRKINWQIFEEFKLSDSGSKLQGSFVWYTRFANKSK